MQQLIERLTATTAVDRPRAEKAMTVILGFLAREAPPEAVSTLFDALPGAREIVQHDGETRESGGFGAMAAFNALTAAGLTVDEVQAVTREVVVYAREKAGTEVVEKIVSAVPGLSAFS